MATPNSSNSSTQNDEELARVLAQEEEAYASEMIAQQLQSHQQRSDRNRFGIPFVQGRAASSRYPAEARRQQQQQQQSLPPSMQQQHDWNHIIAQQPQQVVVQRPPHMCVVPAVMGPNSICVEMMVDTGAQHSVVSYSLAQELGLSDSIDRRYQGVASGVGRAKILGLIRNVVCELGHVEFLMDFSVLETTAGQGGDKLLLLGLDLMRKYKCIVDLERQTLIFGGKDGVEVSMLPPDEQQVVGYRMGPECSIM